jgi:hypothetical protein
MTEMSSGTDDRPPDAVDPIEFDLAGAVRRVATSAHGFGFLTDDDTQFVIHGNTVVPRVGRTDDAITDVALGSDPFVLVGDTIYQLSETGVPMYNADVDGASTIRHDDERDHLVVVTASGSIVWLDADRRLRTLARDSLPLENGADLVTAAGFGWSFVATGNHCYCCRLADGGTTKVLKITVDEHEVIQAVSMTDETLLMATSAGLYAFSTPSLEFDWMDSDAAVDSLSTAAEGCVYGWRDGELYRIDADGAALIKRDDHDEVYPTVDHGGYYLASGAETALYWGTGPVTVDVDVEPLTYGEPTPLTVEVQNSVYHTRDVQLRIEVTDLVVDVDEEYGGDDCDETEGDDGHEAESDDATVTVTVPGLSAATTTVGSVRLTDVHASPELTVRDEATGEAFIDESLAVEAIPADVDVDAELTRIDGSEAVVELRVENVGEIPVTYAVDTDPGNETRLAAGEAAARTETVPFDPGTTSEFEVRFTADREDAQIKSATAPVGHPETPCEVDCTIDADDGLARIALDSVGDLALSDRLSVTQRDGTGSLEGDVTVEATGRTEIWFPLAVSEFSPITVVVESEHGVVPRREVEHTDHQALQVNRTFVDPTLGERSFGFVGYPAHRPIQERVVLANTGERTFQNVVLRGSDTCSLRSLRPGDEREFVRHVRAPEGESTVPASEIRIEDETVVVPSTELTARRTSNVDVGATVVTDDRTSMAVLEVRNTLSDAIVIDEFSIDDTPLPVEQTRSVLESGAHERFEWDVGPDGEVTVAAGDRSYLVATVEYHYERGPDRTHTARCLAPVREPTYRTASAVDVSVEDVQLRSANGINVVAENRTQRDVETLKLVIESPQVSLQTMNELSLPADEPAELVHQPSYASARLSEVTVWVGATGAVGKIDETYRFERSRAEGRWRQVQANVETDLLSPPSVDLTADDIEVTEWRRADESNH